MEYKYNAPQHYTVENISYLLKKYPINRLLITEKADGIYQCGKIDGIECEYEYIEELNKKFIFNSKNNIIRKVKSYDDLKAMIIEDRNDTIGKFIINKPYYRLNEYILEYIDELINIKNDIYPTDGWILICDNFIDLILKLKPLEHMTIDLYYNSNNKRWVTQENKIIDIKTDDKMYQTGIWRLYWRNYKWVPEDRRYDKKKANNYKIVNYIINFINRPFKFVDVMNIISKLELYYQVNNIIKSKDTSDYIKYNNELIKRIIENYCKTGYIVLDIGCGKGKYIISDTKWYGIDIDLGSLYKPNNRFNNFTGIWMDFTMKWDPTIQYNRLGKLWCNYKMNLYEMKQNKFDVVLWLYSIHFCYTTNQLNMILEEIDLVTKTDSILIVNLIKNDFKGIKTSNGFIRRQNDILIRYYDWCNTKECVEKIWSVKDIMLASKKWYIYDIIDFDDIDNEWNEWHKNNYICVFKKI